VRVTPLDPLPNSPLLSGADISGDYFAVQTEFFPTTNTPITVAAGATATRHFAVTSGVPPFRISRIRPPTSDPNLYTVVNASFAVWPGQNNLVVGVYSANLPTSEATLSITGDGLSLGPTTFNTDTVFGLRLMSVTVSVAANATPGLRSLVVQQGNNLAYANGFMDILPLVPDFNFDGLDDNFQRRYFPLWTGATAAPGADADGDGKTNDREYLNGTDPTRAATAPPLKIVSITVRLDEGATIRWQSEAGKRYQVHGRDDFDGSQWQSLGTPVASGGEVTEFVDARATRDMRYYRVQDLP
jgi:hypothetical protein